uniref:sarcalumenin-like n=1 Tax=Myxine glutinosa TaxID=7769 RepID=UPI00358E2E0E
MAARQKHRGAANAAETAALPFNERVLQEVYELYTEQSNGLVPLAQGLGVHLLSPRKKITVLILGNHSAGKSSFINWYIEEHVQRVGVAIETRGFTFVTSGKHRESLTGHATLHLYPHFKSLQDFRGVSEYLSTEVSTSKQKGFNLVTFIDTPGLVDGDMKYPFEVDSVLQWLGEMADLIFVFFDPMGQALCKRTLNIVERLNKSQGDKIRFYLSKADEAGHETDRQRVMMQIVQELCKRPGLNKCGFEMPTIYIPNANKPSRCLNQIDEVCLTIEKTINQTVQTTLNQLGRDCEVIVNAASQRLMQDCEAGMNNRRAICLGGFLGLLGFFMPATLFLGFILTSIKDETAVALLGADLTGLLHFMCAPLSWCWSLVPHDSQTMVLLLFLFICIVLLLCAWFICRLQQRLSRRERRKLEGCRDYVNDVICSKKKQLYEEYLQQSIGEQHC